MGTSSFHIATPAVVPRTGVAFPSIDDRVFTASLPAFTADIIDAHGCRSKYRVTSGLCVSVRSVDFAPGAIEREDVTTYIRFRGTASGVYQGQLMLYIFNSVTGTHTRVAAERLPTVLLRQIPR